MSYYSLCAAYTDLNSTVSIHNGLIQLALGSEDYANKIYLTLNPMQVKEFADNLQQIVEKVAIEQIQHAEILGGITTIFTVEPEQKLEIDDPATGKMAMNF